MIKLNCLCKDWETHRCMTKIIIYHEGQRDNYDICLRDKDGNETMLSTGKDSLLKFAKEIIFLVTGSNENCLYITRKV